MWLLENEFTMTYVGHLIVPAGLDAETPSAAQSGCGKTLMELESCNKAMADTYLPPHRVS